MQITRLQNAIKVNVNGELLFPSGGWEMPAQAQQTIAKWRQYRRRSRRRRLSSTAIRTTTPIGPELRRQGVTSNLILSQKRADNVMQFMISQGVKPNLVTAQGFGDADPVASNATPQGKAQNRRVELTLANPSS